MPKRLKTLLSSFHRSKEIGRAEIQINQAEDQKDTPNIAKPPTYSQPAIQPLQSLETFQPKDLWQTAYDQLDEKEQPVFLHTQYSPDSKDKKAGLRMQIEEIIQVTERKYEAYQQKSDKTLREASRKIIDALLSYREIISTVAGLDPTQHAASAWAIVSLGLKITQNHHDARNALFESSEYLADVITQCAFIEHRLYPTSDSDIRGHVEAAMIKLYMAILRYSGQIRDAQQSRIGRNLSDCFTAITGHPLTELKISVEKERDNLRRWIELRGYLHHEKEAENILLKIDELGESLKLLLEQSSLTHLHVVEGALYDCHVHEHEDFCLPGTRTDLLSRIMIWATSNDKFVFWLNGMAGTGKSTIARTVAQGFKERGVLGASFFFKRGEADRGTATYLITSIVGQLVHRHRQLVPEVLKAMKADPRITSKFMRDQFDQLLYRPLSKLQPDQSTTIVIVIDALDECDGDDNIKLILHLLFKLQEIRSVRLRVVLTSRPELPIRLGFLKEDNYQDMVLHELPAPVIEHDIRLFLEYKLSAIQREHSLPSDWPGNKRIEQLVQMALPLFIFAATLCRFIGDEYWLPEERLTAVLQNDATTSTSDMDRTYLPVLNQLLAAKNKKEFEQLLQEFQNIIGTIVLLDTPLSVVSLSQLTGIPENKIVNRLKRFHSVLSIPADLDAPVRILHLSFRDFLIHTEGDFRINEKDTHRQIALNCLRVIDTRLRHNICDLASYGIQCQDIDPQIIQQRLPADLQYSCYYWVHHLKQSQGSISGSEILSFLQKRFLHWLEALALMGKISEAAGMIKTLESSIWISPKEYNPALSGFLYDARRFTLQNAYTASIAPLQLYCSGLAFAPAQSVIKGTFLGEIPKYIRPLPAVMDAWSTTLQTLEGHSGNLNSVAFSPDGLTLASCSSDSTIKLWDTATGTQQQTLEGHTDTVFSVVFSPDGLTLASGSNDLTIKLWDAVTGTQRQTLEGYLGSVVSVAFSPDGLTLASGSFDNTIKLWDIATGIQRQTLEGHSDAVNSVAFSPDGFILASCSYDKSIKLWEMTTSIQLFTLEGHSNIVTSVAFSPNGLTLASGSYSIIKLWDTATGIQLQTLECHSDWIDSVIFSSDGLTLVSGSSDSTIKIWNIATGTQLQTLEGHSDRVTSVTFSPDGFTLASASHDSTIKIWDTIAGTQRQALEDHSDWIISVVFSLDGQTLASGSVDRTIKLWDIATGTQRQTLEGHSDAVNSVAFSPDGLTLVSGSGDSTIKLWNTVTGTQYQTLEGHSDSVTSVVFSPDGFILASGSYSIIKLWDTATGTQLRTLEGHSGFIFSVTFSPDGLILASGSSDHTIKLWDTVTGTQRQTLEGHSDWIESVAFAPDGLTLVSSSRDRTIKLWDIVTGTQYQTLEGHSDSVNSAAFSPDSPKPSLELASANSQMSLSSNWVSLRGENLLWLSPEYRSFVCQAVNDTKIALGYMNGGVLITGFYTHIP
ncbi:hypothetical protein VI817_003910 [Penicillium citrinum]|nr:hypothetical protein VI817_003910 [Penicillium citrinum]